MDDVNPQASSSQLKIERVDLDALQDDSHDLNSGETHINRSSNPARDEPIGEDEPMIGQEASALQNVQKEDQNLQQHSQDQEVHPRERIAAEDGKSLDGFEFSEDKSDHATSSKLANPDKRFIDTSAPIESVKDAVSKFGGVVICKAHKTHTAEKSRIIHQEQESHAKKDLDLESTNRLIEELKLNLERAHNEESKAKQDSEIVKLRVKEIEEQETADVASVTGNEQLEDERVVSELKRFKREIEDLQKEYESLSSEKEAALKRAETALSGSKEIEKTVEEMKLELVSIKESLESANVAFLEAEEKRNRVAMDGEKDKLEWDKQLKHAEEEMKKLNQEVKAVKDLKRKLNTAFDMLSNLKSELSAYKEVKLEGLSENEVEELKFKTEKTKDDTRKLKVASVTLKRELERNKSELDSVKKKEGMVSENGASFKAELEKIKSEIDAIHLREKEAKGKMVIASQEANDAKSAAESAQEVLRTVKEEAEQARERAHTLENRLVSVQKEMEVAKASEKLAMDAIKEIQERGGPRDQVTVSMEEYDELSKRAQEAEEQANIKVADVMAQVEAAREDEMKSLSKLEEANQELLTRKEVYVHATNKAEKENEAKLVVEQEFRKWSEETRFDSTRESLEGQGSQASYEQGQDCSSGNKEFMGSDSSDLSSPRGLEQASSMETSVEMKAHKKKKRHFFPHIFMLFSKKKALSNTS